MSTSDKNSSYERIVPQIGIAVSSIVFAVQLTNDASLAAAMTRAFSTGVAVAAVLLLLKIGFITALRFGRRKPSTEKPGDKSVGESEPELSATPERPKPSTRVAA